MNLFKIIISIVILSIISSVTLVYFAKLKNDYDIKSLVLEILYLKNSFVVNKNNNIDSNGVFGNLNLNNWINSSPGYYTFKSSKNIKISFKLFNNNNNIHYAIIVNGLNVNNCKKLIENVFEQFNFILLNNSNNNLDTLFNFNKLNYNSEYNIFSKDLPDNKDFILKKDYNNKHNYKMGLLPEYFYIINIKTFKYLSEQSKLDKCDKIKKSSEVLLII